MNRGIFSQISGLKFPNLPPISLLYLVRGINYADFPHIYWSQHEEPTDNGSWMRCSRTILSLD